MRRFFTAAALIAGLLLTPSHARAQDALSDLIGRTVTAVRFEAEGRPETSQAILDLSDVRVGAELRVEDWRATIAHLDALGRYEQVIPVATATPDGVEIVFRLVPRHPITNIRISGETGLTPGAITAAVRQRYGGVPTGVRTSSVENMVVQLLRDEGYVNATVESSTDVQHDPEGATLVLDVRAGEMARIASVEVRGTSPYPEAELLRRANTQVGQPYRRRAIDQALSVLEDDLRLRGYYEAQVTVQRSEAAQGVSLVLSISTGPRVDVRVDPVGALPGSIEELIPVRRLGSADQDLLEDSRGRIEQALRQDGYWKAQAPFTRELTPDGSVLRITFTISRGARYFVDRIELPSTLSLSPAVIRKLIDMGNGEVFNEARFLQGMAAVVDEYRRSGYYEVEAEPSYEELVGSNPARAMVVLHPNITEGPRGVLTEVTMDFGGTPQVPEAEVRQVMRSRAGGPYVQSDSAADRAAIVNLYRNRGFLSAEVAIERELSEDGRQVAVTVKVNEGQQVLIGQISVVGNERVSTRAILDELGIEPGLPAGVNALDDAQRRVSEMGVFRRVTLNVADQFAAGAREAHVIVNVVESPANSIGYGGGLEGGSYTRSAAGGGVEERLEFAPRGFFEIGRRNLGGRNRSLNLFSRVSLKRRRTAADEALDGSGFGFTEYRVTGTYRERRAFRTDTDLLFGVTSEQAVRTGFNYIRKSVNAEALRMITPRVSVSGRYALNFTRLFDEQTIDPDDRPLIDRLFPQVRLSMLAGGVAWDRRDSPLSPTRGTQATADVEVAMRAIGSEVGYVKSFFQLSAFKALGGAARTVLAVRAQFGAARGFERTVSFIDENGNPASQVVAAVPVSQRFFAGGGTTVRGFQLDRLGVPEIINEDGLSLGGNAVVVLNAEVRRVVGRLLGRELGAVVFIDGGNVFARMTSFDLSSLRPTSGFGVRYDTPLGPVRLDFGFKLNRRTDVSGPESGWEYHLSIGEAF